MQPAPLGNTDAAGSPEELAAVRHLVALGYQDPLDDAARRALQQRDQRLLLEQAEELLRAGNVAGALGLLLPAVNRDEQWSAGRHLLARAYFRAARVLDAKEMLHWLELHAIEHVELSLLRAKIALQERRFGEAYEQAVYARGQQSPLPEADVVLGEVALRRGNLSAAEAAYRQALTTAPRNASAAIGLAAVALRRANYEAAVDFALQAVEIDANRWQSHYHLGRALTGLGLVAEGSLAFEQSLRLNRRVAAPYRWLIGMALNAGDSAAAEQYRARAQRARLRRKTGE